VDLVIIASELATNAHLHGGGEFELRLLLDEATVTIEVLDSIPALPSVHSAGADSPSGRGMQIVESLAESWGVRKCSGDGKAVWARLPVG
jgi:anti-sigma regulatory factor (Ser/Thr protein kinase)